MSTDDEADLSPSLSAKYESPAKAKREALRQKLQKEGLRQDTDTPSADLKKLQLSMLKNNIGGGPTYASEATVGRHDDQTKRDQQNNKAPTSFVTKTREQELAAQKLSADTTLSTDQMLDIGKQAEDAKEEMQQQGDIQNDGG